MDGVKPTRILWWEPRWSFAPRELRVFRSSFPLRSWLRIVALSAAIIIPIAGFVTVLVPGLQFNWSVAIAASAAAIGGFLLVQLILLVTVPPLVFVTAAGFGWWWPPLLHNGLSYYKRTELKSVTVTVRDDGRHYLRFRTQGFCKRVGLARGVNLDHLLELFGDLLVVRDRRRRFAE